MAVNQIPYNEEKQHAHCPHNTNNKVPMDGYWLVMYVCCECSEKWPVEVSNEEMRKNGGAGR